jgi:hypothetical protein
MATSSQSSAEWSGFKETTTIIKVEIVSPTATIPATTPATALAATPSTAFDIKDLQNNNALWYKIHVFIYDLRSFREIPTAQARLDRIVDASYIGMPYFKPDEVK